MINQDPHFPVKHTLPHLQDLLIVCFDSQIFCSLLQDIYDIKIRNYFFVLIHELI